MREAKIVIGANWGDEGKGLMTNYFSQSENTIVVCHNGGCQKGHTVVSPKGRHITHHFGSGIFNDADTYLAGTFILNPMIFKREHEELYRKGINPRTFINGESMVTTPYDMIMNQITEEQRGAARHGSCGVGIFETIKRDKKIPLRLNEILKFSKKEMTSRLSDIAEFYCKTREIPENRKGLFCDETVIKNYLSDVAFMLSASKVTDDTILNNYDRAVFEGGQGLALDQNNTKYFPHLTPSNTGSINPIEILNRVAELDKIDIEVCYVTRSYYTKHGAGPFEFECQKEDINPAIQDLTNMPNEYQGTLRFGFHDIDDMLKRIFKDLKNFDSLKSFNKSIAVTHLNYTDGSFCTSKDKKESLSIPGFTIYKSFSESVDEITE